jgi:hypothetical protein
MICDEFPEHGGDLGEGQCGVTIHRAVEDADTGSEPALTAGASVRIQFLAVDPIHDNLPGFTRLHWGRRAVGRK